MNNPNAPRARTSQRTLWSAVDLLAHEFPEPKWAVPGIVPEGLTLLAGPPKVGKSWLSLNLAVSVAAGQPALGSVPVEAGHVLYLALEDTPRRLQRRLDTVLATNPAPSQLGFAIEWPAMPNGGADLLDKTLTTTPSTRLVVVDVLAKVRGSTDGKGSLYDTDYAAMGHLKTVADTHNVAIVVVHHVRKSTSEDFLETISGTNGLAGAADTIAVLRRARNAADATLNITGRDVEENEYALKFDPAAGAWLLLDGPATDYSLSDTRRTILDLLRAAKQPLRPAEIATHLKLRPDTVRQNCSRMARDGQIVTDGSGHYSAPLLLTPGLENSSRDTPLDSLSHLNRAVTSESDSRDNRDSVPILAATGHVL